MTETKYLYLTRAEWADAWISGGEVPLSLASAYLSDERSGSKTPDEVIHRELHGISDRDFEQIGKIAPGATANIRIGTVRRGEKVVGRDVSFVQRNSDGLILCLSNEFSEETMARLEKVSCVEIPDWRLLLNAIGCGSGCDPELSAIRAG